MIYIRILVAVLLGCMLAPLMASQAQKVVLHQSSLTVAHSVDLSTPAGSVSSSARLHATTRPESERKRNAAGSLTAQLDRLNETPNQVNVDQPKPATTLASSASSTASAIWNALTTLNNVHTLMVTTPQTALQMGEHFLDNPTDAIIPCALTYMLWPTERCPERRKKLQQIAALVTGSVACYKAFNAARQLSNVNAHTTAEHAKTRAEIDGVRAQVQTSAQETVNQLTTRVDDAERQLKEALARQKDDLIATQRRDLAATAANIKQHTHDELTQLKQELVQARAAQTQALQASIADTSATLGQRIAAAQKALEGQLDAAQIRQLMPTLQQLRKDLEQTQSAQTSLVQQFTQEIAADGVKTRDMMSEGVRAMQASLQANQQAIQQNHVQLLQLAQPTMKRVDKLQKMVNMLLICNPTFVNFMMQHITSAPKRL